MEIPFCGRPALQPGVDTSLALCIQHTLGGGGVPCHSPSDDHDEWQDDEHEGRWHDDEHRRDAYGSGDDTSDGGADEPSGVIT